MERGLMMVLHSAIIGLILFILMVYVFKQKEEQHRGCMLQITLITTDV